MINLSRLVKFNAYLNVVKVSDQFSKIVSTRNVHTCQSLRAKLFIDNENRYAHQILQNHSNYNVFRREDYQLPTCSAVDVTNELQTRNDWTDVDNADVLSHLKFIAKNCQEERVVICDDRFDGFVDYFTSKCFKFTDEQLTESLKALACIPETNSLNTKNFVELWSSLDDACVERIQSWDIDRILLVCDHWYILNLGKVNKFNWHANKKLGRRLRKLAPHHLVQTMFYCNLLRNPIVEMIQFEINMSGCIGQMSIDEISVMCMGFFKTQTSVKDNGLLNEIYQRLMKEMSTVKDISFVNIIKCLRYSSRVPHAENMKELLNQIEPEIPRFSLLSCLHILLLGTDLQLCHNKCVEIILHRFNADIPSTRLKDLERISFAIGLFNFQSKSGIENDLCANILKELKTRVPEIVQYPRCLPSCLHFLTFKGFSDNELISSALDPEYLKVAYGKSATLGREIFALDSFTKINLKGTYDGNILPDKKRKTMGRMFTHYLPDRNDKFKLTASDTILLEVKETVDTIYDHCYLAHVLPHFERPDVIVAIDKRINESVNVQHSLPENYSGEIITKDLLLKELAEKEHVVLINFIIAGWNNFVRKEERLTGLFELKLDQSKRIGFVPIIVPWFKWPKLTESERSIYLKHQIATAIS